MSKSLFQSRFIVFTAALSVALFESPARAQDPGTPEHPTQPDQDHINLGLGAVFARAYEGSEKYRTLPLPAIDVQWGPLFANLNNGIGINIVDNDYVTLGSSVTFMTGYRRQDAPRGIGSLSTGVGARAFASVHASRLVATVGATKVVAGGTKGTVADVSLASPFAVSARLTLVPSIGATWADSKHNNRYFGVDAAQSLASGLTRFAPGGGVKDASATLSASYLLTDRWTLQASVGATTLHGKVKDSPIVVHRNAQPVGFVAVTYRLGH